MSEPVITYVLSVVADERLQALRGEAAVMANDAVVWSGKVGRKDVDGHVSWAVVELAQQAKAALDAASASKPDAAPPPPQPRRPARKQAQGKGTIERGVSRSRLR
jgi:hypothetical protein